VRSAACPAPNRQSPPLHATRAAAAPRSPASRPASRPCIVRSPF